MTDLHLFEPLSLNAFIQKYKREVRCAVDWDIIRTIKRKPGVHTYTEDHGVLYAPHYEGGTWMNGKSKKLYPGGGRCLLRCPGVFFAGKVMILDGYHRLTQLHPFVVVVDVLYPNAKQARGFVDLFSKGFLT